MIPGGRTTYDGSWGFVFLGQTTKIPPVSDADYFVLVTTPDGGLNLRTGPGTGFDKLILIPDYEQLHIRQVSGEWGKNDV
jgi:hypothetical protein